jgi:hypothetical protein
MNKLRVAVVETGEFGKRHMRAIAQSSRADLAAVVDIDPARAAEAAAAHSCEALPDAAALAGRVDAAVVAVPTIAHVEIASTLLEAGIDVLVEKPIARTSPPPRVCGESGNRALLQWTTSSDSIRRDGCAGGPTALFSKYTGSARSPRSLDDVVLDLMIHDIDVVLSLSGCPKVRAAGTILSRKVDWQTCGVSGRLRRSKRQRVSTEQVRKLRLFSRTTTLLDTHARGLLVRCNSRRQIVNALVVAQNEPCVGTGELFECVETRSAPRVTGRDACRALEVALRITAGIAEHAGIVAQTLASAGKA